MSDAFFAVQQGIYNALAASSEVTGLLGNPLSLYDHVPPGAAFPYAVFGPLSVSPYDTKTETGFEQIVTLKIWSHYRGGKEAQDILQALYDTLHHATLAVAGQVFLSCEFHSADLMLLDDGLTTHAAARYTVITQAE
jgi:hypothetical protein